MRDRLWSYGSMGGIASYFGVLLIARHLLHPPASVVLTIAILGLLAALLLAELASRQASDVAATAEQQVDLTQKYSGLLQKLQRSIGSVAESSHMLDQAATESSKATESIAFTIGTVADGASQQAEIVRQVLSCVEDVQRAINQVSDHSKDVTAASVQVFSQAESGQHSVESMVNEIQNIARIIKSASGTIDSLAQRSEAINEITNTIKTIAEQTNLLALNAAIEAARAGDQGRGFAVVADEVRKLAEGSANSVDQINQIIRSTINDTALAQKAMLSATQAVDTGVEVAGMAEQSLSQIVHATQNSRARIEDIGSYIKQLNENALILVKGIDKIAQVADQTAHKSQDVAAATQEQTATIQEMSANAAKLNQTAGMLAHLVTDFQAS